jgi:flagella basal body P-ring formation protein FlgA
MNHIVKLLLPALLAGLVATTAHGSCLAQVPQHQPVPQQKSPQFALTVKPVASARGASMRIGELCDITPTNRDALAIGSLVFGPSPRPGHIRRVTRTQLLQTLAAAGYSPQAFTFRGAVEASAQTITLDVSATEIVDAARTVLDALLEHEGAEDVDVSVTRRVASVRAPAGREFQKLRAQVRGNTTHRAAATVDVEIVVDGEVYKSVPVAFTLARYQQVLMASSSIRKGDRIGMHNVEFSREKVGTTQGLYLTRLEDIEGMIASRDLRNGRLLMLADVSATPIILRGDLCEVVVQRGRIEVRVQAVAENDAAVGQPVVLRNAQSKSPIKAIARAPGLAVVSR